MKRTRRLLLSLSAAALAVGGLFTPAAFASASRPDWTVAAVASPVSENAGSATFVIERSPAHGPASISFATHDGSDYGTTPSATAGVDYEAQSGTLQFAPRQASETVTVPIIDNALTEPPLETFYLEISDPSKGSISEATAAVEIQHNQPTAPPGTQGTVSLDTANWMPGTIYQQNFVNNQAVSFDIVNSGTSNALIDVSGHTNGYSLVGQSQGCASSGTSFSCSGIAVDANSSTQLQLTLAIPTCDFNSITVTLDTLNDPDLPNQNSSPTLSHTFTPTPELGVCPTGTGSYF